MLSSTVGKGYEVVAPHAGAWIEMHTQLNPDAALEVAPHAGAWIEMKPGLFSGKQFFRRSPCGSVD